jgi:hypothetical protein
MSLKVSLLVVMMIYFLKKRTVHFRIKDGIKEAMYRKLENEDGYTARGNDEYEKWQGLLLVSPSDTIKKLKIDCSCFNNRIKYFSSFTAILYYT